MLQIRPRRRIISRLSIHTGAGLAKAHFVQYYLEQAVDSNVARRELLHGTGIEFERLGDRDYSVEILQIRDVIRNLVASNEDPLLSFRLGEGFSLTHLGLIGHGIMSCESIASAARYWHHFNLLVGNVLSYPSRRHRELYELEFEELCPLMETLPFCVEQSLAANRALFLELTGKEPVYQRIEVAYPQQSASTGADHYRDYLGCPVVFGARRNRLWYRVADFDRPISMADEETSAVIERHCQAILADMTKQAGLGQAIRQLLLRQSRTPPTAGELAKQLGMSERSLRRKLDAEGISYSRLLSDFRRDLATEYLQSTGLTPKEIAYLVGYTNISSFRRAFKTWTGKTLGEFRA